jgi:hypothetical protein
LALRWLAKTDKSGTLARIGVAAHKLLENGLRLAFICFFVFLAALWLYGTWKDFGRVMTQEEMFDCKITGDCLRSRYP